MASLFAFWPQLKNPLFFESIRLSRYNQAFLAPPPFGELEELPFDLIALKKAITALAGLSANASLSSSLKLSGSPSLNLSSPASLRLKLFRLTHYRPFECHQKIETAPLLAKFGQPPAARFLHPRRLLKRRKLLVLQPFCFSFNYNLSQLDIERKFRYATKNGTIGFPQQFRKTIARQLRPANSQPSLKA